MVKLGQYHINAADSELAGAVMIGERLDTLQERVLALFRECGSLTDEEMRDIYEKKWGKIDKNSLEPRRWELMQVGLLRKTDLRRKGKSGINRIVWEYVYQPEQLALL